VPSHELADAACPALAHRSDIGIKANAMRRRMFMRAPRI
jgi:hypothetical protein